MAKKFAGKKLVLATNNPNKIAEIRECFHAARLFDIELIIPQQYNIPSPPETENTFVGNAKLKAKYYAEQLNLPSLADDTGMCIAALNGRPGVFTADWLKDFGHYRDPIERIEAELAKMNYQELKPQASAVCSLALYWPEDEHFEVVSKEIYGHLDFDFKNVKSIGFRPIFVPVGSEIPLALMNVEQLKAFSHRVLAVQELLSRCFY